MDFFFQIETTYMTVLMPAICWNICKRQPRNRALRTDGFCMT